MKRINIIDCMPGMVLARPIYHKGSMILLEQNATLSSSYINRIQAMGISEIYIEDDDSEGIIPNDLVNDATRLEAITYVRNVMDQYSDAYSVYTKELLQVINNIIDDIFSNEHIMLNIMDIKNCDDYTFSHSVNVAILSIATGSMLGLSREELKELGTGAILHDIGKIMIPEEILKKNSSLTDSEYELIKQHSELGYEILCRIPDVSQGAARVALSHHERVDGRGYPNGNIGGEIHIYSKIVAIADVFDALTSDRIYRKKISNVQAIEYLSGIAKHTFDNNVLLSFLKIVPPYPVGNVITLSTGDKGIVQYVSENTPTRPVVRIVYNADGSKKNYYEELDLSQHIDISIIECIKVSV